MNHPPSSVLHRTLHWLRGREPAVLAPLLVVTVAGWGFVHLASEVVEGDTDGFDKHVVRSLRRAEDPAVPVGPEWLADAALDTTALGGVPVLVFVTLAVAAFLVLDGKSRLATFLTLASATGLAASSLLKYAFARPRPDVVPHLANVHTSSFPSGHSMLSAVVYLTLGVIVASAVRTTRLRIYVVALALTLTVLVGLSRVYLGVHYPTDVLAGWSAGLAWAMLCWLVARRLRWTHVVESAPMDVERP